MSSSKTRFTAINVPSLQLLDLQGIVYLESFREDYICKESRHFLIIYKGKNGEKIYYYNVIQMNIIFVKYSDNLQFLQKKFSGFNLVFKKKC